MASTEQPITIIGEAIRKASAREKGRIFVIVASNIRMGEPIYFMMKSANSALIENNAKAIAPSAERMNITITGIGRSFIFFCLVFSLFIGVMLQYMLRPFMC